MKVVIHRLGHHGDGIADGPIFAPRTLPGEVVEGEPDDRRIADPRIVMPSPDRVSPPCRHYRSCGGCDLQHASDPFVAQWKTDVVRAALEAQGVAAEFRPIVVSPPRSRRRATLHGRRLKKGVVVGFHGRASGVVTPVPECRLVTDGLLAVLPALESFTALGASRKNGVDLAVSETESGVDVCVSGARAPDVDALTQLAEIVERHDLSRVVWNGETTVTRRPPVVRFGPASVALPPGAFLQATREGEAALVAAVRQCVGRAGRAVDLFSGCGTLTFPLAETAEVHAVEGDDALLDALSTAGRKVQGLRLITTERRDLFRNPLGAEELARFDAAVIDPPRAGAEAQTRALAQSSLPRVAAVSCNPVTFARDARILVDAGFRLDWVQVVDQFRWSPHVELAACFSRGHMA